MKTNEWRAYGMVKASDVAEAVKSFKSRTGSEPVRALISTACKPEIAAAVEAAIPQVKQEKSMLPFDLWLACAEEKTEETQGQQGLF